MARRRRRVRGRGGRAAARRRPRGRRRGGRGLRADRLPLGDSRVEWALSDHPAGTRFVVTEHRFSTDSITWGPKLSALAAASYFARRRRRFSALSGPTRREVLRSVATRPELTASRLAGELPITRQAVAKHLAALQRAGLVEPRREGRETHYTITPAPLMDAMSWMAEVGAEWDGRLARLAERARG